MFPLSKKRMDEYGRKQKAFGSFLFLLHKLCPNCYNKTKTGALRDSTVGRECTHGRPGFDTQNHIYGHPNHPGIAPKFRAKNKPWALPGVAQTPK